MKARNYLLFLILSLFFKHGLAQSHLKDSLRILIKSKKEDTAKINLYYDYGQLSADSASYYFKKAKTLSDKYNHVKGKLTFASLYGGILNEQGKLHESYLLGIEALSLAEKHHLGYEKAKTCNNIANVFNYMGEFDSSMIYFLKAASIFEKLKRIEHLNVIYENIGSVYLNLGDYEKSIEYSTRSIKLSRKKKDTLAIAYTLTNLGGAYVSLNQNTKAIEAFEASLKLCEKNKNSFIENLAFLGLGNVYTQEKKFDLAIRELKKAKKISEEFNYTNNLANALNALALVYFEIGEYAKANQYTKEAVKINEQYHVYNNLRQQYKLIADIQSKMGLHASAYSYLMKYVKLNDSLSGVEQKKHVLRLEKEYKTAEKDKQIAEKNLNLAKNKLQIEINDKSIKQKNNWLFFSLLIVLLLVASLFFFYYLLRQRKKLHEHHLFILQKDQELMQMKAKIDGQLLERKRIAGEIHDEIGSGLSIIHLLSNNLGLKNEKTVKIAETSSLLINQMSEIIWSMNFEQDNLVDFVSFIRYQSSLLLSSADIEFEFHIPEDIPYDMISGTKRRNMYLVVKEALHNIIKHAEATQVIIHMDFSNGIFISIQDNGKGISENKGTNYGNGMKNMKQRMSEIGGSWFISSHKPFKIEIELNKDQLV